MTSTPWGPALEAEVAYRLERARRSYRPDRAARTVRSVRSVRSDRRGRPGRPRDAQGADAGAGQATVPALADGLAGRTGRAAAPGARRRSLSGSEAWPAA